MSIVRAVPFLLVLSSSAGRVLASEPDAFVFQGGDLVASDGGEERWRATLDPGVARGDEGEHLRGPAAAAGRVWACARANLYAFDAASGRVLERTPLPGECASISPAGERVRLVVAGGGSGPGGSGRWRRTYEAGPGAAPIPVLLPGGISALLPRSQARSVVEGAETNAALEAALPRLAALAAKDPTNPWYAIQAARALRRLGRPEEALAAARGALEIVPAADFELCAAAPALDPFDPALGDEAFRRGVSFLLRHGYEPELALYQIGLLVHLRPSGEDDDTSPEALLRRARRLADLAPRLEGATFFWSALRERGVPAPPDELDRFDRLARESFPYRLMGAAAFEPGQLGLATLAFTALVLSILAFAGVKTLRTISAPLGGGAGAFAVWNPLSRWTRGECLGLALLLGATGFTAFEVAKPLSVLATVASSPLESGAGNLGHPESVGFLEAAQGRPGAELVRGVAAFQAGDLDGAVDAWLRSDTPEARSNLGVLAARRGEPETARLRFEEALARDPSLAEAAWNLGRPVPEGTSLRVDRARRYGLTEPLLALPTADHWKEAWEAITDARRPEGLSGRLEVLEGSLTFLADAEVAVFEPGSAGVRILFAFLVLALAAAAIPRRALERGPARFGFPGWALGFVVPGTARQLSFAGPFLLVPAVFAAALALALEETGGVAFHPIELVAVPSFERWFGAASSEPLAPVPSPWPLVASLWWVLPLANALVVFALERSRPDPDRGFERIR